MTERLHSPSMWLMDRMRAADEKVSVVTGARRYTYRQLCDAVECAMGVLTEHRVQGGEVVAMRGDYSFQGVALFLALATNGNIIVPIATRNEQEIAERVQASFADREIVLQDGERIDVISCRREGRQHQLVEELQRSLRAGLILFSSGSTGKPKAMIHNLDTLLETYRIRKEKRVTILVFLLFDHIGGLNTLLNALAMTATIVVPARRDPEHVCKLIEQHGVNVLPTSPTFLNLLLVSGAHRRFSLHSLRLITYGTEPMPESLLDRLKAAFPRVRFLQTFGTSETGIAVTSSRSSRSTFLRFDDPQYESKIVHGELWLRSRTQIMGYLNAGMENFTEDGWFKTGDLVEEQEGSYFRVIGRATEIINVGGVKVSPSEVESALLQMAGIQACLVYGEPNALTGQTVVADVVLRPDIDPSQAKKEVRRFLSARVDAYKIPTKVNVVEQMTCSDRFKRNRLPAGVQA